MAEWLRGERGRSVNRLIESGLIERQNVLIANEDKYASLERMNYYSFLSSYSPQTRRIVKGWRFIVFVFNGLSRRSRSGPRPRGMQIHGPGHGEKNTMRRRLNASNDNTRLSLRKRVRLQ